MKSEKILKILLVEDNPFEVFKFKKNINSLNIDCHVAHTTHGRQAIESLQTEHLPDLILLDLEMPKLRSLQFLKIIKEYEHLKNIPTFIHASHIGQQELSKCFKLGIAGFIIKTAVHKDYIQDLEDTLTTWYNKITLPEVIQARMLWNY